MNRKANMWAIIGGVVLILIIGAVLFSFVPPTIRGNVFYNGDDNTPEVKIALKAATLTPLNLTKVDTYESYQTFADNTNALIDILNEEQKWFNIPKLQTTQVAWEKISKVFTEYSPLIGNYNDVVFSAKKFISVKNDTNLQDFYIASARFSFETITIAGTFFYSASYETVGAVYRASGLQELALSCPTCVRFSLSTAHWTIRNTLVETSDLTAKTIIDNPSSKLDSISMSSLRNEGQKIYDSSPSQTIRTTATKTYESVKNTSQNLWGSISKRLGY